MNQFFLETKNEEKLKEKRKEKWLGCEKSTLGKAEMSDGEENMTRKKETKKKI